MAQSRIKYQALEKENEELKRVAKAARDRAEYLTRELEEANTRASSNYKQVCELSDKLRGVEPRLATAEAEAAMWRAIVAAIATGPKQQTFGEYMMRYTR